MFSVFKLYVLRRRTNYISVTQYLSAIKHALLVEKICFLRKERIRCWMLDAGYLIQSIVSGDNKIFEIDSFPRVLESQNDKDTETSSA